MLQVHSLYSYSQGYGFCSYWSRSVLGPLLYLVWDLGCPSENPSDLIEAPKQDCSTAPHFMPRSWFVFCGAIDVSCQEYGQTFWILISTF